MKATIVYVDGFNVYYGALKGTPYKWLDYQGLAGQLLRGRRIERVKYFTARVEDRDDNPAVSQRQDAYLRALTTRPAVQIEYGHFRTNTKSVPLAKRQRNGTRKMVTALVTEEKGSDVSLGAHLVWDACHENLGAALILSNDSDLQTPVNMARQLGVESIVCNPHRHRGQANHLHGDDTRNLRIGHLAACQLSNPVVDSQGRGIHKPPTWPGRASARLSAGRANLAPEETRWIKGKIARPWCQVNDGGHPTTHWPARREAGGARRVPDLGALLLMRALRLDCLTVGCAPLWEKLHDETRKEHGGIGAWSTCERSLRMAVAPAARSFLAALAQRGAGSSQHLREVEAIDTARARPAGQESHPHHPRPALLLPEQMDHVTQL